MERLIELPQGKLNHVLDKLRWIKSPAEVELMRATCQIGSAAMNATIKESRAVPNEAFISGRLEYEYRRRGAAGSAYVPVVAAGERANTIHYIDGDQDIKPNDCVLVDAGCDLDGYVSDISRSFPVSGTFTDAQKTLYDALNAVHGECLNLVMERRPLKLNELYFFMLRRMAHHFAAAKIFTAGVTTEEALNVCDDLCPHHISHYLGLDVHDTFGVSRSIELPPGVVITVEPGVYIRHGLHQVHHEFHGIGYRIEDDVLITKTGAEVLTVSAVRCSSEIEKLMASTE
uniref:Peptidase_M24 domain-containing protein n=1 Tax=Panagrellus redivivus TaxID=6233 RepID=A0A7E4WD97_PANRE